MSSFALLRTTCGRFRISCFEFRILYNFMDELESQSEIKSGDKKENTFFIPAAIIVAGALIAFAVVYSNRGGMAVPQLKKMAAAGESASSAQVLGDLADDDPALGNPSAPVTMVEFADFQCPFCARMFSETLPQIKEKYVKTGKVKFVYRDFPLSSIHQFAQKAAEAGECADEQEKFWQYHDILYSRQQQLSNENIKKWADEIGLDIAQFNQCLDSGKYMDEVAKDLADGQAAGVTGTPGTFVNGRLVSGALPYAQFEAIIEAELKK
ncbi:MAG: DSBA oxidoreductase [Parcubacteria group bacterium GW2011_GWA2_45_30]|nr:MAG: DSBA oxidoreductase [Parcubacteria group bacterium GW2011_GWA2_45_30]